MAGTVLGEEALEPVADSAPAQAKRRWHWRLLRGVVWAVSLICVLGAGAIYFGIGTRLNAPDWLRARVEMRIEQELRGLQIEFGEIHVVVNQGWRPRIGLRDVTLRQANGAPLARLADAEAALAMRPLLRGQIQPKSIWLGGLFASLVRAEDRSLALSFAEAARPMRQAPNMAQLLEQWHAQLELPVLSALVEIRVEGLTLRYQDDGLGRVWTLDGGQLRLERSGQMVDLSGSFSVLSGRGSVGTIEANYSAQIGKPTADFGILVQDIDSEDVAIQSPALGWMQGLRAPLSGSLRGGVGEDGALLDLSASLQIAEGVFQPGEQTRPIPIRAAHSYFSYEPARQILRFDELRVQSDWVAGAMTGEAHLSGIKDGLLTELVGQLRFTDLWLHPRGIYETPFELPGVLADFRLYPDPFRVELGQMVVQDTDTAIVLDGALAALEDGWSYALNGQADQMSVARIKELWPTATPPNARNWVRENLIDGMVRDANLAVRGSGNTPPYVHLDAHFDGAVVRVQKYLPQIQQGRGVLTIDGPRLVVSASAGWMEAAAGGRVDVSGTSFIIPDMEVKPNTPAVVRVRAGGSVTAALSLLDIERLRLLEKAGLPVDLSKGQVALEGTLSLPLNKIVPPEDIFYHYRGVVRGADSSVLVPGHRVQARELQLVGNQAGVTLSGQGSLSGVPITARWQQPIVPGTAQPGQVTGQVDLNAEAVAALRLGLPAGAVSGQGRADYRLDLVPDTEPRLSVTSDLAGIGLQIPEVSWRKRETAEGSLSVLARLATPPVVEEITLDAPGLRASGAITLNDAGGLNVARFDSVDLGWFRGPVTLTGRGGAVAPAVGVSGGTLDMRRAPFSDDGSAAGSSRSADGTPITVALDRLQVTDSIALAPFQGSFTTVGGFNGKFTARLNGAPQVSGTVLQQGGGTAIRIKSEDAGGVFRAADILRHGSGGSFDMMLLPAGPGGEYDGNITIRNTRVKDAPAMAAIVNSLSLVGLVNELAGQGILFSEVEATFRLNSDHLIIHKSSAVGPSIGLSMDGNYDLNRSVLNLRGVISPIYLLNAIGSVLTRKGEGLIGFSFTLRGTADDPRVQVNPLSGLAPGFLREIFRGRAPELVGPEGEIIAPPPVTERAFQSGDGAPSPGPVDTDSNFRGGER